MKEVSGESVEGLLYGSGLKKRPMEWSLKLVRDAWGLEPSHSASVQLVRSLVVSVIALIADFGSLIILKEFFGVHYLLAAALSFSLGVVVNYGLSVRFVFARRKLASKHAEFVIFVIICAVGLGLNLAIIGGLVQLVYLDYRIAKVISTAVVFFWNFVARKKILY
jgi:putative flippase GtrA